MLVRKPFPCTYMASVISPKEIKMTMYPVKMVFLEKGEKHRFMVTIWVDDVAHGEVEFGELTPVDDKHIVFLPF